MKYKVLILTLIFPLFFSCGRQIEKHPADSRPAGWEVALDRQTYLPYFEQYVNNHPRISMPLQMVYTHPGNDVKVYRGIVVGEKADKARETVTAYHGYDNCRSADEATAEKPPILRCRPADSGVTVTYLFHDASPTETYVYAILDSTRNDVYDPSSILQSFISETTHTLENR